MRKRYRNRCGICITSPKVDETMESNKLSKCNDAINIRISCPSGEEIEMASVKGICNLPSISVSNQPNSSFQLSSMIVKRNFFNLIVHGYFEFAYYYTQTIHACINSFSKLNYIL